MSTNNQKQEKRIDYLTQVNQELRALLSEVETLEEVLEALRPFIEEKLRESFKNGIEVGMKKAARQAGNGQAQQRPAFHKFKRKK
jgi:hypothetical protein